MRPPCRRHSAFSSHSTRLYRGNVPLPAGSTSVPSISSTLVLALPVWKVPETAASSGPVTGEEVFFSNLHSYTVTAKGKKSNIEVPISFKPEAMLGHAVKPAVTICSAMSPRNQGARQKSGLRMTDSSEWCKHSKYRIRLGIRRTGKSRDPIVELYSFKFEL